MMLSERAQSRVGLENCSDYGFMRLLIPTRPRIPEKYERQYLDEVLSRKSSVGLFGKAFDMIDKCRHVFFLNRLVVLPAMRQAMTSQNRLI